METGQYNYEKNRNSYSHDWHTHLLKTICEDFPYFCFALWCSPCASYSQRKRALHNDMSRYQCCAGYRSCSGKCCEAAWPGFCLCTEVVCFLGSSVQSTRFLLQDELQIRNTKCDSCIIAYMSCMKYACCICLQVASIISCGIPVPTGNAHLERLPCVIDAAYCSVCPCMLAQQKIQLDERDRRLSAEPTGSQTSARPSQQMGLVSQTSAPPSQQMGLVSQTSAPPSQQMGRPAIVINATYQTTEGSTSNDNDTGQDTY